MSEPAGIETNLEKSASHAGAEFPQIDETHGSEPLTIYRERAYLIALMATRHNSVLVVNIPPMADVRGQGWPVIYMDSPEGQLSWHIHPDDMDLFTHVPREPWTIHTERWDGSGVTTKYARIRRLTEGAARQAASLPPLPEGGRPSMLMGGTFAVYDDGNGGIVAVADTKDHGIQRRHIPAAMVKMATTAFAGKGPFGSIAGIFGK